MELLNHETYLKLLITNHCKEDMVLNIFKNHNIKEKKVALALFSGLIDGFVSKDSITDI